MEGIEASVLIPAVLTLVGVFSGALLQHLFTRTAEKKKQFEALRVQSYVDYLRAVSRFAQAAKTDPDKRLHILAEAADAKTRMTIYGSKQIAELLASFERSGATLTTEEGTKTFLLLVSRMRSESIPSHEAVSENDIEAILFGLEQK